ncbi:hypothetical protein B0H13DRAFT_1993269 [Mycena leptocephala]|nr:hypothetical protein B0H13DRAFT_1993269 [Mycena leptocephala]
MTRIPQEPQENPWTPVGTNTVATPPDISEITRQIGEQNATIQQVVGEFNRLQNQLVENHSAMLARLDSLCMSGANSAASRQSVAPITRVKYIQDAAVLAYLIARWIDPNDGSTKTKELGPYKAVRLSSYVAGVGEYENELWFTVDGSGSQGATFRQTGTTFKGWFQYTGLYRPFIAHDNVQAGAIARVKYVQNAAVSAYLLARWIDPSDGCSHSKDLGSWKAIATQEEFNLVDEGIPEGSSVRFASNVAGVGVMFRQTGTAFKGFFTLEELYDVQRGF